MEHHEVATKFAPAERAPREEISRQAALFQNLAFRRELANAVPAMLFILNRNRQIVFANRIVNDALDIAVESELLGQRPGEAVGCVHAKEMEGGCGTTEFCSECGAVKSILICQKGKANEQECRITRERDLGSMDLRISCTALRIENELFTVFVAADIVDEKRREALQHIFFHDLMNLVCGLKAYLELSEEESQPDRPGYAAVAHQLVLMMIDEIRGQRELVDAEEGNATVSPAPIHSIELLEALKNLYQGHKATKGPRLFVSGNSDNVVLTTDRGMLQRVVGNMIKNALETSTGNSAVTIGCTHRNPEVEFWVHNEGCMPRDVQLQVFQRSFSTKGVGRGLGTYSMKLLGERYLKGKVSFTSSPDDGTTFRIVLPPVDAAA